MSTVSWNSPLEDFRDSDDTMPYRGSLIHKESVSIIKKVAQRRRQWLKFGAGSRTRTYEALRREIYSLLWLPLHDSSVMWSRFSGSNRGPTVYKTVALASWAKAATEFILSIFSLCDKSLHHYFSWLMYFTLLAWTWRVGFLWRCRRS